MISLEAALLAGGDSRQFCQPRLRYLEQLRNDANECARDLAIDIRELTALRLRDLDCQETVAVIGADMRRTVAVLDLVVTLCGEGLLEAARPVGAP